ncbi:C4-dicarboxylate anaerobic carrier [Bifidobacterium actinocoloniiforme DSM 22766]|uniref:C4-dicarboxylate anaerobic carrier n=1 Tax=Bifidobacterium actinocoloniiforme DSM 22766 TaxID=1437605 RepID=A0A086Z2G7_9BIFI|nr:hypothetical protein [Bifidobacterium actinocoloniiforme]AKV55711.1 hypothetical protein AB656_05425 [Bifidobacterium actinocoloniiforme DSM 22766]KFI40717.1 C4-dicarboxylate anaerobic carrier [Bifidobacterium actinocoloniiforme DSM 22766]
MASVASGKPAERKVKKNSMPNAYVILFLVIAFIGVLTWFAPGGACQMDKVGQALSSIRHLTAFSPCRDC